MLPLICLGCRSPLGTGTADRLECGHCGRFYPILDGIPSFLPVAQAGAAEPACDLTVVIPVLNEAANLSAVLSHLREELDALRVVSEIIVVDGGSSDPTPEVARGLGATVIRQETPGYGGALRAGFAQARGRHVLTLDGDGSHDPAIIAELWKARTRAEVIIASRYVPSGRADMPRLRRVLSLVLNIVYRRGLSLPVKDLSSGYRLYARSTLAELQIKGRDFDVLEEILIRAVASGARIREVPFHYRSRISGQSHARLARFAFSYVRSFASMWKLRNSIESGDYDDRAYDSLIPLQRSWQRQRCGILAKQAAGFASVLDVGCGSSRILGMLEPIVGLDVQLHKLRYARRFKRPLVHGSIFELPFADATFDCVICSEVVEHLPADDRPFDELLRVLRPGGRLVIGTPDYDRRRWRMLEAVYGRLAPGGYADEHITHYSQPRLTAYLQAKGATLERVDYVWGSEMILTLRKASTPVHGTRAPVPVTAALRSG